MTAEWTNLSGRFERFIGNLQPTPLERRRAIAATEEIACRLARRFRFHSGPPASDAMLVGGHAKGTAIRPARVVDMLYLLPADLRPRTGDSERGRQLLDDMTRTLSSEFATREAREGGWLWVRTLDGTAVRLVPCFRTTVENFLIALPGDRRGWVATNPEAELTRLHEADMVSGGKATHLLMMLKSWRRHRRVQIGSFTLELLVGEFVRSWTYPRRSLLFYDWMVRDFFFWLGHQQRRELLTPGALENLYVGDRWTDEADRAFAIAQAACVLERENRDAAAVADWRSIFGPDFDRPAPALTPPKAVRLGGESAPQPDHASSRR